MVKVRHTVSVIAGAALLGMMVLSGCASSVKPFAGKGLKGGEGMSMAILSFDNMSKTQGAGKSLESLILTEFLSNSPVRIIEPGEVAAALSEERVRLATSIPRETVQTLGKKLGVDLFMIGVVHEYDMLAGGASGGSGQTPVIAMTLRILDAKSGEIVWAVNTARSGNDSESVFGIGKISSLNALAHVTARQVAAAFADSLARRE